MLLAVTLTIAMAMVAIAMTGSISFHGDNLTCAFAVVQIKNGTFQPASVYIFRNATVVWTNPGPEEHSICVGGDISPPLMAGESYTKNFHEFGVYEYYCRYHPGERGTVIVR
jgi:plastocyanin